MALWCHRLANLNRPEFHIYDRDNPPPQDSKYQQYIDEVNQRENCRAVCTNRKEAENYIHKDAINEALRETEFEVQLEADLAEFDDIPSAIKDLINTVAPQSNKWGENRAKEFLCSAATSKMNKDMLDEIDPNGEVIGWIREMKEMLESVD